MSKYYTDWTLSDGQIGQILAQASLAAAKILSRETPFGVVWYLKN